MRAVDTSKNGHNPGSRVWENMNGEAMESSLTDDTKTLESLSEAAETIESILNDVMTKILEGFPIKTLCLVKCVSKHLDTLIKSPDFTKHYDKLHHDERIKLVVVANSSLHTLNDIDHRIPSPPLSLRIPVNNTHLVGSSNGLVCLYHRPNSYSLFNPTTREFRLLPDPGTFRITRRPPIRLSGFGYVRQLDDFMVVSAAIHKYGMFPPVVKLYSAKADSWRTMPARVKVPLYGFTSDFSVYVDGVAYWLGWSGFIDIDENDLRVRKIMGFDFANEEFNTILLHENINQGEIKAFAVLDGCLCVLVRDADLSLGMWVMKERGVVESWTKTFSFKRAFTKPPASIFPICVVGNEVLFEINNQLVLYDPVENITTKLKAGLRVIRERDGRLDIARYEESIVSPSGYICKDKRQIADNVAEENEVVKQVSVYEALQNVYGAIQCPDMREMLHRTGSPGINTSAVS